MSETEGVEIGRVTIVRYLADEGVMDSVTAANGEGEDLPLTEALGMMRLAEDSLIRSRMENDDE